MMRFLDLIDYWLAPLCIAALCLVGLPFGWAWPLISITTWLVGWTFFEYWLHRAVFHTQINRPIWRGHMDHHKRPAAIQPLRQFTPLATLAFTAFSFAYPLYAPIVQGFLFGYWGYLLIHLMFHTIEPPPILRKVWERHEIHHHVNARLWFGLTTNFWDFVFGTAGPVYQRAELALRADPHQVEHLEWAAPVAKLAKAKAREADEKRFFYERFEQ
jgi:sterol desaturase/sphingolipid hydroxylase (fatty acid hydroxylase superfamily)